MSNGNMSNSDKSNGNKSNTGDKTYRDFTYLGIDPGIHGGMAAIRVVKIDAAGRNIVNVVTLEPMPQSDKAILQWLNKVRNIYGTVAVVEKVGGFIGGITKNKDSGKSNGSNNSDSGRSTKVGSDIGDGDKAGTFKNLASAHTTFQLGVSYGKICMALAASGIPYRKILPKQWQGAYGMHRHRGETKTKWKNRLKDTAIRVSQGRQIITLATADAYLLADYCRRFVHL